LTSNIAGHLAGAAPFIQKRAIDNFSKVDPAYGKAIEEKIAKIRATKSSL